MKTPDAYSGYIPMDYEHYMENMGKVCCLQIFAFAYFYL
jgi:hypothetical protein